MEHNYLSHENYIGDCSICLSRPGGNVNGKNLDLVSHLKQTHETDEFYCFDINKLPNQEERQTLTYFL